MIIWGGNGATTPCLDDGARYEPTHNSWSALAEPPPGFSARAGHAALWTGSKMIVWGGRNSEGALNTGAIYDPALDSWTLVNTSGAPSARIGHTATWLASKMVIWAGRGGDQNLNSGAGYSPESDNWQPLPLSGAPEARV